MERNIIKNLEEYKEKTETGQFNESIKFKMNEFFELVDYTLAQKETKMHKGYVKTDRDPRDYMFELVLNTWDAAYMTGYRKGIRAAREKFITSGQAKEIETLYTPEEISSILKRLKKGKLSDITRAQAGKMISRRTDC